jgi:hypothetical protein
VGHEKFWSLPMRAVLLILFLALSSSGCAVVAVADAAVSVATTAVKVSAAVVGTTVGVAAKGVKVVVGSSDGE